VKAIVWFGEGIRDRAGLDKSHQHRGDTVARCIRCCIESAARRGLRVTGSEIVGMVPKKCLVDAGRYFLRKQRWSEGASEEELIDIAIRSMGLKRIETFRSEEK